MLKWLFLPYQTNFFEFFEKQAALTVQAAQELLSLVSEGENIVSKAQHIKQLEHEADQITHHCIESLHKTFITPFERDEILRLTSRIDDILDFIEETAACLVLYDIHAMRPDAKDLAHILLQATQLLETAIKGLNDSKQVQAQIELFIQINQLENEGDTILRHAISHLFNDPAIDDRTVIKWKEIYENLENGIDSCEDVANIMEGVILERG